MEERHHATTQNRFYLDMSNVDKNITVEAKLISPPTNLLLSHRLTPKLCVLFWSLCHALLILKYKLITTISVIRHCPLCLAFHKCLSTASWMSMKLGREA